MIIGNQVNYTDDWKQEVNEVADFELNVPTFMKTHTFLQAMTGSGKTNLILELSDGLMQERKDTQFIFFDEQEEFTGIPKKYKNVVLISSKDTPKVFTTGHAYELGLQSRRTGQSLVIKLADFKQQKDKELFVANFLEGYKSEGKKYGTPCVIVIDEADLFVPTLSKAKNVASREPIIWYCKRARKLNISIVLATQYSSAIHIDARREMENYFIGRTKQRSDRKAVCEMLGENSIFDTLGWGLKKGQFFVRGDALSQHLMLIQTKESDITKKEAGVDEKSTSSLSKIYEQSITEHSELTVLEMLQKKVAELEKELVVAKSKELTDDMRKNLIDMGYNEGLQKGIEQEREGKGKFTKFVEKL